MPRNSFTHLKLDNELRALTVQKPRWMRCPFVLAAPMSSTRKLFLRRHTANHVLLIGFAVPAMSPQILCIAACESPLANICSDIRDSQLLLVPSVYRQCAGA